MKSLLLKVDRWTSRSVEWGLICCVLPMIVLSLAQIVSRWMGIPLQGIDVLLRHLVLLTSFWGGVLTFDGGGHLGLDLLEKFSTHSPPLQKLRGFLHIPLNLISAGLVLALFFYSLKVIKLEAEDSKEVFWGLKTSQVLWLIPLGLFPIALRFFCGAFIQRPKEEELKAI